MVQLVSHDRSQVQKPDSIGITPLHRVAANNFLRIAKVNLTTRREIHTLDDSSEQEHC
jgi:hypothetical protein